MKDRDQKLWPYKPRMSIVIAIILLIVLLVINAILYSRMGWPPDTSANTILIGIFLTSLFPVLLVILDTIINRGGSIGYKDFKIDFSKLTPVISADVTVPANIGVRGVPVYDSDTSRILDALKESKKSDIVIIDIEDGKAWWETRFLVLLSGAVRIGTPEKIVFIGNVAGQKQSFIGWAKPAELLELILPIKQEYKNAYLASKAAAKQWELIEPIGIPSQNFLPPFPFGLVANGRQHLVFDDQTGLQKDFLQEQFLQSELGLKVETFEQSKGTLNITHGKLIDLCGKALITDRLDEKWAMDEQIRIFFSNDASYFVLTENSRYLRMVPRLSIINEMIKNIVFTEKMPK